MPIKRVLVNQAWPIYFDDCESDDKASFLYWVNEHFPAVQVHGAAQLHVYQELKKQIPDINVDTVVEFFGGSGIGSGIIQGLFKPAKHYVYDKDSQCVTHLQAQKFTHACEIWQGDAKEAMLDEATYDYGLSSNYIIACDFFSFSAYRIPEWDRQFEAIFALEPLAVQITDTSIARLHLQRERYAKVLGREFTTTEGYLNAFSDYMWEHYNYVATDVAYREFACFMFRPAEGLYRDRVRESLREPKLRKLKQEDGKVAVMEW